MAKTKTEVVLPPGRLWPNTPWGSPMEIEVFGATGEFATGKTILGLSIAPGVHPEGHEFAGQPRTLYLDLEKSGTSYAGTGCKRVDVPAEMTKVYGAKWTSRQAAEWFNSIPQRVKPGQYDVCMVDPINDIESGEVDIVKANPIEYGYTKAQLDRSVPLLMSAVKAHYKKLLMGFAGVFKCLYFATHLRDEFKGGSRTGRREPRGKETLAELASLYLWLERLPDDKGKTSAVPSARVMKHRLSDTRVTDSGELEVAELMPRRIPVATVQAIRSYIANPPNIEKPASGEKVIEKPVSDLDIERMRLATAEAQAAAASSQAALIDRQKELAEIRRKPVEVQSVAQTQLQHQQETAKAKAEAEAINQEITAKAVEGDRLKATAPQEDQPAMPSPAATTTPAVTTTPTRVDRFNALLSMSGMSPEKIKAAIVGAGAERFSLLSEVNQDALLTALQNAADKKATAKN